jgi:hypothetical protein
MAYTTETPQNPVNQGDLTQGNVQRVEKNPNHPNTAESDYPSKYPSFVRPTNAQMSAVLVEDETHPLSDVDTDNNNRCFLQHQPVDQTTITVSDGVLNDGLTDWENGIIYFSTLPVGEFTVQYLSNPDKYYGEYLQAIEDVIHMITWLLGAGPTLNEGIKNAEIFLDSLPAGISSRMPNSICIRAIDRDIEIRSSADPGAPTGTSHRITIGNGEDTHHVDVAEFRVKRSADGNVVMLFGDETGDHAYFAGNVDATGIGRFGPAHESANPGISGAAVASYENTGDPYVNETLRLAVHGDAVIYGDLIVFGSTVTLDIVENIQLNVFEENLEVGNDAWIRGSARLGSDTGDTVAIAGDAEITGGLKVLGAGGAPFSVDGSITFTNGDEKGEFEQSLIDGMDPSYWACVQKYLHGQNRHETVFEGFRSPLFEGTISYTTGMDLLTDTGIPGSVSTAYPTGTYYAGKFDDGDFFAVMKTGVSKGERVPVKGFNVSTGEWTLVRPLEDYSVGDEFAIVHEGNGAPDFIESGPGLSITVVASDVFPLIGWKKGKLKIRESNYEVAGLPDNSTLYIHMTVEPGVNGIDEDEPTFFYSTSPVPSDWSIPIAKVVTSGGSVSSVLCFALNASYDSLWVLVDSTASGNRIAAGADWTHAIGLGDLRQRMRKTGDARILIAPDSSNAPDKTLIRQTNLYGTGYYIKTLGETSLVIGTPSGAFLGVSLPYWARVIIP